MGTKGKKGPFEAGFPIPQHEHPRAHDHESEQRTYRHELSQYSYREDAREEGGHNPRKRRREDRGSELRVDLGELVGEHPVA